MIDWKSIPKIDAHIHLLPPDVIENNWGNGDRTCGSWISTISKPPASCRSMIPTCSPWIFRPAPSIITCSPCACRRKTASSVSRISISATRSKRPWNSWKRPWNKKNSGRKNSPHQYRLPRGRCLLRPCFRVGRSKPCAGGDPLLSQDPSPG